MLTTTPLARMLERETRIAAEVAARTGPWQRPPKELLPTGHTATALCPYCNDRRVVLHHTTGDAFWPLGQLGEPSVPCPDCEPKLRAQLEAWKPTVGGPILIAGVRDPSGAVPEYCVLARDGDHLTVRRLGLPDFPQIRVHARDAHPRHLNIAHAD